MRKAKITALTLAAGAALAFAPTSVSKACTTVIVGKKATTDGSTLIARNEDVGAWSKHFYVHAANSMPQTYISQDNGFKLDLPKTSLRYTSTPDGEQENDQWIFGEDGINSANVAMSATESGTSNKKALKADPLVKNGISEASMLDVILPYIHSAKEGVLRLGQIVEKQGSAENNGVIFSDKNEIWYMEIGSGHTWAAVRVPDTKYAVIPNQMVIGKLNLKDSKNYLASTNLTKKVKAWSKSKKIKMTGYSKGSVYYAKAFGTNDKTDSIYNRPRMWDGQRILTPSKKQKITKKHFTLFLKPDKKVSVAKVGTVLSSHFTGTKYSTYGKWKGGYRPINVSTDVESHILQIRNNVKNEIAGVQWLAMASPATSVYLPFYTNITDTPSQYKVDGDYQDPTNLKSAYWTYKTTGMVLEAYKNKSFLDSNGKKTNLMTKDVKPTKKAVTAKLKANLAASDQKAKSLNGNDLSKYLTEQNQQNADYAQSKWQTMNKSLIVHSNKLASVTKSKLTFNK